MEELKGSAGASLEELKLLEKSRPNAARLQSLPPLGSDARALERDFKYHFLYTLGQDERCRYAHYPYKALALCVRDRLMAAWEKTRRVYEEEDARGAFYLSMEYLLGRLLGQNLVNLGLVSPAQEAMANLGFDFEELVEAEPDAGLGNGGLGRLAACFLESSATLQLPVMGYGLRYEFGMFRQEIRNGYQVEEPDHWLKYGNVWEIERPEWCVRVKFGGRTEVYHDGKGRPHVRWVDTEDVCAIPYDIPIPGFRNGTVNTLRLWKASATEEFNLKEFQEGDYPESVAAKNRAEQITLVLYPNDAAECGKELRLRQQYFLASASLQDVLRRWVLRHGRDFSLFAEKHVFQLNDTHPAIAVAELMRLLVDEYLLPWEEAWAITTRTMAYTNHTLLPEALEKWPVRLFQKLLPRLLEIIYEINARFLEGVEHRWPGDVERLGRMSLIEEGPEPQLRMAHLAVVGSFSVNGVSELHTELLKKHLFRDFYELWPEKFRNVTNGISPRRFLLWSNPRLSKLITETIGPGWETDLERLRELLPYADDPAFQEKWREVRIHNRRRLIDLVRRETGVEIPDHFMLDVQVKRIHEYKRQLLNLLHVIHLYDRIKREELEGFVPRAVIIGGKAAPGYHRAKMIIKLINNVARVINRDPATEGLLRLVFLPDYRVSLMETICAGTDLSEQISTAGKEASGTGNMKFMLNGALTIGTYDGANIEIFEAVGPDHFFLFGLKEEEIEALRPHYNPQAIIEQDEELRRVMFLLESGFFNRYEPGIFDELIASLKSPEDPWMTIADFRSYLEAHRRAARHFQDHRAWTRSSIINTASAGRFSSDRSILEYNRDIWRLEPVPVRPEEVRARQVA